MPRKGSGYDGDYELLRKRILGGSPRCAYCNQPGTTADHVPPKSMHNHKPRGCRGCHLVPSCDHHRAVQGGLIRAGKWSGFDAAVDPEAAQLVETAGFDVLDPVWDVPWLTNLREVPASAVWPRLMTVPHVAAVGSYGPEFERWCKSEFGVTLRWWQRLVARRLLEHDVHGRLVWRTLILTMARQLGKSTLLAAILLWRLVHGVEMFGEEQLLLHVARLTEAAHEVQRPARTWAQRRADEFKVIEANGKEKIEDKRTSSRWLARAENAAYGFSATTALADECWDIKPEVIDEAVEPTLVAHEQPQLLLTSTAHRKATSLILARRAMAADALDASDDVLLIEWSALRHAEIDDRSAWRMASPHWDVKREKDLEDKLARAKRGDLFDLDEPDPIEFFKAQWMNIWPAVSRRGKGEELVDEMLWRGCRDVDIEPSGPLLIGVEDCFGRGASVAAACLSDEGRILLGGFTFDSREAAYAQVSSWVEMFPGSTVYVGSLLKEDAEVVEIPTLVEPRGSTDTRSALSLLRELVAAGRVIHDGSDVESQVLAARVTPAPSGGLQLIASDRFDLVRAAAWVVAAAHREAALVPVVHGGA